MTEPSNPEDIIVTGQRSTRMLRPARNPLIRKLLAAMMAASLLPISAAQAKTIGIWSAQEGLKPLIQVETVNAPLPDRTMSFYPTGDGEWVAVRREAGSEDVVMARSSECPGVLEAVNRFADIRLNVGPLPLLSPPDPMPIPPTIKDGGRHTVWTSAWSPEWAEADIVMTGSQGPHAQWAVETIQTLQSCWT